MTSPDQALRLGPTIKETRIRLGLSLRQLAAQSGVPRTTIERIEQQKLLRPRPDILHTLGRVLGIPIGDLYTLANYPAATALPSFAPYLRARYSALSPQAVTELEIYFTQLAEREGIPFDSPNPGEDEKQ